MNLFFSKSKLSILLLVLFLCPYFVFAQTNTGTCSSSGYSIYTINGINTNTREAQNNKTTFQNKLKIVTFKNEPLTVDFLYNQTHLAGIGDLIDSVRQGLFDQKSDYDLIEILNDASQKITTEKVLLVGHSQGNFYANNFYNKVAGQVGGIPAKSLGVYGVATPASSVAGGGLYLTSDTDKVIAAVVGRALSIMPLNTHIILQNGDDILGHDFSDVYLKYRGDKIISDIFSSLGKLKTNDIQKINEPCMSPPELTKMHKVAGALLAVIDPLSGIVKEVAVNTTVVLYKVASAIGNTARNVANATGAALSSFANLLFNNNKNLAANTPATVILATQPASPISPKTAQNNFPPKVIETPIPDNMVTTTTTEVLPVPVEENTTNNISQPFVTNFPFGGGGGDGPRVVSSPPSPPPDTTAPVITLTGNATITLNVGDTYTEAGATVTDDVDGSIAVVITGTVDTSIAGAYIVHYNATDTVGNNATEVLRTVTVNTPPPPPDTTPPVITILGNNPKTILLGSVYSDAGATALDNVDGDITANIVTVNLVNSATIGAYTVTYMATDVAGNTATATRTVNVAVFISSYLENFQNSLPSLLSSGRFNYCHIWTTSTPPDFYNFGSNFIVSSGGVNLENIGVRGFAGSGTVHSANLHIYAYGDRSNPRSGPFLVTSFTADPSTWSTSDSSGTNPSDFPYVYFSFPSTFLPAGTYWFDFGDCASPSSDYFGVKATASGTSRSSFGDGNSNESWYKFGAVSWDYGNFIFGYGFDWMINGSF
jgi:hypothetical protein